jgi:heme/copper-type cytochrome/quinol oxidase subunit 3
MKKSLFRLLVPLLLAAATIALLTALGSEWMVVRKIDPYVVQMANLLLLLTSSFNVYFQKANLQKTNPQAVMRGIIGATMVKLFFLATLVLMYLMAAGENRSVYAVIVSMGCYIIYSWLETRISLQLKSEK